LSLSKEVLLMSDCFLLDTDNFTVWDPWTWRWREETRVIPVGCDGGRLKKEKKDLLVPGPKKNPALVRLLKRLVLVRATPWADLVVIGVPNQLFSNMIAIFPLVKLFYKDFFTKIMIAVSSK